MRFSSICFITLSLFLLRKCFSTERHYGSRIAHTLNFVCILSLSQTAINSGAQSFSMCSLHIDDEIKYNIGKTCWCY